VLGATVAAMFPKRMDRIVLDGNVNLEEWHNSFSDFETWERGDETFSAIWSTCIDAGPELCPLARTYSNSTALESDVWKLLDSVVSKPIVITSTNGSVSVDYNLLKQFYTSVTYGASDWPATANLTYMLLSGNTNDNDELYAILDQKAPLTLEKARQGSRTAAANNAIRCADRTPRTSKFSDVLPAIDKVGEISRLYADVPLTYIMTCAQWPKQFEPPERYTGRWSNLHTQHPILLIGNTFDPVTGLASTYNTSAIFQGSGILEVEGYGHTTLSISKNECMDKQVSAYFVDGVLPEKGKRCEMEYLPYHSLL
jgi:hypothetical protein